MTAPAPFCSITEPTRPLLCFPNAPLCHDSRSTLPHSPHSHEKHSCPFLSSEASHPTELWQLSDLLRTISFQRLQVPLYSQYQLGPLNQLLPWHFIQVTLAKAPRCFLRKSKSIPLPPLKLPLVQPCRGSCHHFEAMSWESGLGPPCSEGASSTSTFSCVLRQQVQETDIGSRN